MKRLVIVLLAVVFCLPLLAEAPKGYYRQPSLHGDTIVFVAEGDIWRVSAAGGSATRLTSHPGLEAHPDFSPDGTTIAFLARYEGPRELYTMPLGGGLPARHTWGEGPRSIAGWTPDGRVLFSTRRRSTLPESQLVAIDVSKEGVAGSSELLPLAQASDGDFDGETLYFTRFPFQGSQTKRYKGGIVQDLWRFTPGDDEAQPLTRDYPGTSKRAMVWDGRIYFVSDRDGHMNLWSMDPSGSDLLQHTEHAGFDVKDPDLQEGRIVYQWGADLYLYDIAADQDRSLDISLDSDLDHTRENWIEKPMDWLTSAHLSPDGDRVALTARGQVFVARRERGRFVVADRSPGVRHRDARFLPESNDLLTLSDATGEVEIWTLSSDGRGESEALTTDGEVLRWQALPSPDGKWIAHRDKNQRLWVLDRKGSENRLVLTSDYADVYGLSWSPDSRWLAFVETQKNLFGMIRIYDTTSGEIIDATTDRWDHSSPAWSADGEWLYFLSDRHLVSAVGGVWGTYQPEPYLDKKTEIFQIALKKDTKRSPFTAPDEVEEAKSEKDKDGADEAKSKKEKKKGDEAEQETEVEVTIDQDGLIARLHKVPMAPGNYSSLSVTEEALFWLSSPSVSRERSLVAVEIGFDDPEMTTVVEKVDGYEASLDGKRLGVRKDDAIYIIDAKASEADLSDAAVDLSAWNLSVVPREEWRQMFDEAWRLERDYFYDQGMHGVDWPAMREKYRPLVDRVTDRDEFSDLIAQMVAELSALHIFVRGGDFRESPDDVRPASLGALLERDEDAGGYRVVEIYQADPDEPHRLAPIARPGSRVDEGEVILSVNGIPSLSVPHIASLLRHQAGQQVLLEVRSEAAGSERQVVVEPFSLGDEDELRYHQWELTRRRRVDELGSNRIGYVHLRAMGARNFTEWAKGFYPVFQREGLIIDARHNRGGNIDSWILSRLIRKAWMTWNQRAGKPSWTNMQYAFEGHIVVLVDQRTASDGEAFADGFRRLGLGKVIGMRTWGGEIWLSSSNFLVDRGIATSAEFGVFGPEGEWLIEGHGFEPDIEVDNLPHATFKGQDAQLEAAVEHLMEKMDAEPMHQWEVPDFPDKSGN